MLTITSFIDRSEVSGLGVFTSERISKGTIIWVYNPLVDLTYSEEQWNELKKTLSSQSFASIQRYSYKEHGKHILCTDNAQFMNHSSLLCNISNSPDLKEMFANRDVESGEELLCNYFEYSDSDDHHLNFITR